MPTAESSWASARKPTIPADYLEGMTLAEVTVSNEATRSAVQAALWRYMSSLIERVPEAGEQFGDEAWGCAERIIEGIEPVAEVEVFDARLSQLVAVRTGIASVAEAELGVTIELGVASQDLAKAAKSVSVGISEDERFWDQPTEQRARSLEIYDALHQLTDAVQLVEAVA